MKKAIIAVIILTLVGAGIMLYAILRINNPGDPEAQIETATASEISFSSLQTHNSASNCWIAFGGRVFSITRYIDSRPDEKATLEKLCGLSVDILPTGMTPETIVQYQIGILAP